MESSVPIAAPITGKETGSPGTPLAALAAFYRAFNGRDLTGMRENWAHSRDVVMDNPLGGIRRSWAEIAPVYERLFRGLARVYVEFYDYTLHEMPRLFYAVGRERGYFTLGDVKIDLAIRTTRIYRHEQGQWRQVHHHGSIEDPEVLHRYQCAVQGQMPIISTH